MTSVTNFKPPFADLAGSIFFTLPPNLALHELSNLISQSKDKLLQQPTKLKVIFDNYDPQLIYSEFVQIFGKGKIVEYNSNFFKLNKADIVELLTKNPQLNWQNYSDEFVIKEYTPNQKNILINLLLNSFAVNFCRDIEGKSFVTSNPSKQRYIFENFEKHSQNQDLKIFLVYARSGEVVGTFGLNTFGDEVQLSAVAGRFVDFENHTGYKGAKKLPVISAAFVHTFNTLSSFCKFGSLAFSNSKPSVIEFYSNLGFKNNLERKGFILNTHNL